MRRTVVLVLVVSAVLAAAPAAAHSRTWIVDVNGRLWSFPDGNPAAHAPSVQIKGSTSGSGALGIDFRPATGELFLLDSSRRLHRVDPDTGTATHVAPDPFTPNGITSGGLDFNPVSDRLRVVDGFSSPFESYRVNPDTGLLAAQDTDLSESVSHLAYDRSVPGAAQTTLYGIHIGAGQTRLVTVGGVNGVPSPNGGQVTAVGPLGFDSSLHNGGMDIGPDSRAWYAGAGPGGPHVLATIDLAVGAATVAASLPAAFTTPNGIAVQPTGKVHFADAVTAVPEGAGQARLTITREAPAETPFDVDYAVALGTAAAGDLSATSGRVRFAAGQTSQTLDVPIADDTAQEDGETFTVTLSNAAPGTAGVVATAPLAAPMTTGVVIVDDDKPPVQVQTQVPDKAGPVVLVLPVSLRLGARLRVPYACSEACAGPARLTQGRKTLARTTVRRSGAGRGTVTFRLGTKTRRTLARSLRRRGRITVRAHFDLADPAGNRGIASAAVRLRR